MSKVRAILLNNDFYSKPRNVRWIKEHGGEAVAILQSVWVASAQERGFKILKEEAYAIPFLAIFPLDKIIEVLESAVTVGLLEEDEIYFFNSQIVKNGAQYERTREANTERQRSRRDKQELNNECTEVVRTTCVTRDNAVTPINININNTKDLNKELSPPIRPIRKVDPPVEPSPPENATENELELWEISKKAFPPVLGDEPWLFSNAFIQLGRKPMKSYTNIWITQRELWEVLKLYESQGLSPDEWKSCFEACESRAKTTIASGKPPDRLATSSWLTGFILNEKLQQHYQGLKIQKAKEW